MALNLHILEMAKETVTLNFTKQWIYITAQQWQKLGKLFTDPTYNLYLSIIVISDVYRDPWFHIKVYLQSTVLLSGFQSSPVALKSAE